MNVAMNYKDRMTPEQLATVRFWEVFRKLIGLTRSPNEHESESAMTKAHRMLHERGYKVSNIPNCIRMDPGFNWRVAKRLNSKRLDKPTKLADIVPAKSKEKKPEAVAMPIIARPRPTSGEGRWEPYSEKESKKHSFDTNAGRMAYRVIIEAGDVGILRCNICKQVFTTVGGIKGPIADTGLTRVLSSEVDLRAREQGLQFQKGRGLYRGRYRIVK